MNNAKRITNFKQRALSLLGFCGLGLLLGLQTPYSFAAPSTTLSDNPMILVTPTHPQVLLLLNNSQSMDGNLSGAIMTGALGNYSSTDPGTNGFTPPVSNGYVSGKADYTVNNADNSPSRMNVAKASIKQILSDYASSNDFGLMTVGISDSPVLYNTWVYYMSSPTGGFTFASKPDITNKTTYLNPCYPPIAANISSADCTALAGRYGSDVSTKQYVVAAGSSDGTSTTPGSSDDPQVNDVLYAGSLPSAFVSYSGPHPASPYYSATNTSGFTLAQYNSGGVFEGYNATTPNICDTCWGTSPTNAGYVPYSPEVLYVSRGFGYCNNIYCNNSNIKQGALLVPIAVDSPTRQATFNTLLAPETNNPTSPEIKSNTVNAATAGMLEGAYDYYTNSTSGAGNVAAYTFTGTVAPPSPPPNNKKNNCDTNKYVVLVTDGLPTLDLNGKAWPPLGSLAATGYGVKTTITNGVLTATDNQAVNDTLDRIKTLKDKNILTYVIGMGAGVDAAKNPAAAATLQAMAKAGGTGTYFPAKSPADVSNDMVVILEQIKAANGTTTSAAVNSTNVKTTSNVFQATFDYPDTNNDWTGDLVEYPITNGIVNQKSVGWSAYKLLDKLSWDTDRHIVSFNPSSGKGIPFRWPASNTDYTRINSAQQSLLMTSSSDTLGPSRLSYVRGDQSLEQNKGGSFRNRTHLLGDIANSTPLYVGSPFSPYQDSSYQTFQASASGREPMIYVGANDGMLHAFKASSGQELYAFVPNSVFSNLINLTKPTYNTAHKFFVDGSPSAGDVKFGDGSWHTILTGGLNNGGNSIYAIDITTPPSTTATEADIAKNVLWEYSDTNLGRTYSRPTTALITTGGGPQFVVIFGSGYNNSNGRPYLYILNAQTGVPLTGSPIDLCAGQPITICDPAKANGLSSPAVVLASDGGGAATLVYAGDLQGNLWKVDLTAKTFAGTLVFKATDGSVTPKA
ncbi:MAG: pilus assembly protein, partial [Sulfuricaulis sp.]